MRGESIAQSVVSQEKPEKVGSETRIDDRGQRSEVSNSRFQVPSSKFKVGTSYGLKLSV
jgi:hypothetical protein